MKYPCMEYDEQANAFSVQFRPGPGAGARDIAEGVIATLDERGRLVMIELVGDVAADYPELVAATRKSPKNRLPAGAGSSPRSPE